MDDASLTYDQEITITPMTNTHSLATIDIYISKDYNETNLNLVSD